MEQLKIKNISKKYIDSNNGLNSRNVLDNISLRVTKGEFISVFGSNGCGKSTLLKLLASIETVDSGQIKYNDSWNDPKIKMIFQNYRSSLFPWRKNIDNIAFPLEIKKISKKERYDKVEELLESLNINLPLYQYPYQLSGGQQQMLVISRTLIDSPDILLCDEPFSALDYEIKYKLEDKLSEIWLNKGLTIIFVSHELDEAIYLANRLVLLSKKPAQILIDYNINLKRPRNQKMKLTQDFFDIKRHIQEIFEKDLFNEKNK